MVFLIDADEPAIEGIDGILGVPWVLEDDKCEAGRSSRDPDRAQSSVRTERILHVRLTTVVSQSAHVHFAAFRVTTTILTAIPRRRHRPLARRHLFLSLSALQLPYAAVAFELSGWEAMDGLLLRVSPVPTTHALLVEEKTGLHPNPLPFP